MPILSNSVILFDNLEEKVLDICYFIVGKKLSDRNISGEK